ncbi:pyridoxal-phosphate dependent enzyme [Rhizobium leguminosarum]|uniref:pyridoxal-phosphate dependent enzyme n=1 Tax=Rhizobium leguminosarum TaxID=384 RepID=UPI001C982F5D|nr:pyridoxal-phosphate dependent enzyme [Rhizobium leguminosarum]MBY5371450.1 pyridoxal-phosphate dependent enzyme [Rhizobium leguminosarum]
MIITGISEAIGNTPLLALQTTSCELFIKLEYLNPCGSMKDRMAASMLEDLLANPRFSSDDTVIESSSGNTASALSMLCAERGLKFKAIVDHHAAADKIRTIRAFAAEALFVGSPPGILSTALRDEEAQKQASKPGHFWTEQHNNPMNAAGYEKLAQELLSDLGGKLDMFVAAIGTGGSLCGTARTLKSKLPHLVAVGVEPVGSIIFGGNPAPYLQSGTGTPEGAEVGLVIDYDVIDNGVKVGDAEAFAMCRVLARRYGLLVGGSAGGAIFAALQAGVSAKRRTRIAVLACDSGTKYLDTIYNDEWLESQRLDLVQIEGSIESMLTPRTAGVQSKPSFGVEHDIAIEPSAKYIQEAQHQLKDKGVPDNEIEEIREIAGGDMRCLRRMLERKRFGEPNAYLRGFIELLGRRFSIDRRTYIPDPYPITLIRHLVSYLPVDSTLLEVGTGCGWIATTLACERPDLVIHAADIDPAALAVARQNAHDHGASITFHESYFADDVEMSTPDFLLAVLPYGGDAPDYSWRELERFIASRNR